MEQLVSAYITSQVIDLLTRIEGRAPRAARRLTKAVEALNTANSPGDYQAVALHCRDALIDYADSVFSPEYVSEGEPQPKYDHFVNKLVLTLRYFEDRAGSDKARKLLRPLADHVQSRQHDATTDAEGAASVVTLTVAVLIETERLIHAAASSDQLIAEFGIYRCPICRSRSLDKEPMVEYDSDGPSLAGWQLFCPECGWWQIS